jgi:hypothetical protein
VEHANSVAGFLGAVYDPAWFVAQQIPKEKPLVASENSIVLAHQLGNLYLGMCFVGLSLFWSTSEVKVIRSYLVALLIADAGHVGFTWYGMGSDRFFDVSGWNAMAWGNLGATVSVSCWTCIVAVTCVGIAANHVSNCHSCSLPLPALRISQASLVQIMPLQAPSNQARKRVKPFDRLQSCNRTHRFSELQKGKIISPNLIIDEEARLIERFSSVRSSSLPIAMTEFGVSSSYLIVYAFLSYILTKLLPEVETILQVSPFRILRLFFFSIPHKFALVTQIETLCLPLHTTNA